MNELACLLVPALRWDRAHGFRYLDGLIDDALELGVGGFLIDGGPKEDVAALIGRLHAESRHPILVAANAERGAGGAFSGFTTLPALGAVSSVAVVHVDGSDQPSLDVEVVRRAARLTVRELKNVGVNWALAPVCDLDAAPGNPDVGARGASGDPAVIGAVVAEWIDTCQADAVVACAMHFPGIGRARALPQQRLLRDSMPQLRANDFRPFESAIDAGVASVMIAPVAVPAFGAPEGAMTSAAMIENVLRTEMHFDGIACTVPFDREPAISAAGEAQVALAALGAGCDVILAPGDLSGTADALARAAARGELPGLRVRAARDRVERWAGWARPSAAREPSMDDVMWSRQLADRAMRYVRGKRPRVGGTIEIVAVGRDGDLDTVVEPFVATLRAMHIDANVSAAPAPTERAPLAILYALRSEPRDETAGVASMAAAAADAGRDVVVVACCHPRDAAAIAGALTGDTSLVCAWDTTRPMLEAAARSLVSPTLR